MDAGPLVLEKPNPPSNGLFSPHHLFSLHILSSHTVPEESFIFPSRLDSKLGIFSVLFTETSVTLFSWVCLSLLLFRCFPRVSFSFSILSSPFLKQKHAHRHLLPQEEKRDKKTEVTVKVREEKVELDCKENRSLHHKTLAWFISHLLRRLFLLLYSLSLLHFSLVFGLLFSCLVFCSKPFFPSSFFLVLSFEAAFCCFLFRSVVFVSLFVLLVLFSSLPLHFRASSSCPEVPAASSPGEEPLISWFSAEKLPFLTFSIREAREERTASEGRMRKRWNGSEAGTGRIHPLIRTAKNERRVYDALLISSWTEKRRGEERKEGTTEKETDGDELFLKRIVVRIPPKVIPWISKKRDARRERNEREREGERKDTYTYKTWVRFSLGWVLEVGLLDSSSWFGFREGFVCQASQTLLLGQLNPVSWTSHCQKKRKEEEREEEGIYETSLDRRRLNEKRGRECHAKSYTMRFVSRTCVRNARIMYNKNERKHGSCMTNCETSFSPLSLPFYCELMRIRRPSLSLYRKTRKTTSSIEECSSSPWLSYSLSSLPRWKIKIALRSWDIGMYSLQKLLLISSLETRNQVRKRRRM